MTRPWVCFFSQTGSEICYLAETLNRVPDAIVTNKSKDYVLTAGNPALKKYLDRIVFLSNKPTVEEYNNALSLYSDPLVTLHGYMRIVPPEICQAYEIYNLHPGLITKYPELKGKDPQERAFNSWHPVAGCVIHKCTAELDSGEVVCERSIPIKGHKTAASVVKDLHNLASVTWLDFFKTMNQQPQPAQTDYVAYVESRYPVTCEAYKKLQQEEYATFCRKQHDYGSGNISLGSSLTTPEDVRASLCSIIFRQFDKIQRLLNLIVKRPDTTPANESVDDAFGDLACYSKIALIVRAGKWGK